MCDCISRIEKQLVEEKHKFQDRKILKAKIDVAISIINNTLCGRTTQELELELEGLKRPKKTFIQHSYCPFCGEKYELPQSQEDE